MALRSSLRTPRHAGASVAQAAAGFGTTASGTLVRGGLEGSASSRETPRRVPRAVFAHACLHLRKGMREEVLRRA